jgi:hypothetical protein
LTAITQVTGTAFVVAELPTEENRDPTATVTSHLFSSRGRNVPSSIVPAEALYNVTPEIAGTGPSVGPTMAAA